MTVVYFTLYDLFIKFLFVCDLKLPKIKNSRLHK